MNYDKMICEVILWSNGIVAVFDEKGHQISDLQGPFLSARIKLVHAVTDKTHFYIASWNDSNIEKPRHMMVPPRHMMIPIKKEMFFCETWEKPCGCGKKALELESYNKGFVDALGCFAWWKDGEEFVGICGNTLSDSIKNMTTLHTYDPPEE